MFISQPSPFIIVWTLSAGHLVSLLFKPLGLRTRLIERERNYVSRPLSLSHINSSLFARESESLESLGDGYVF